MMILVKLFLSSFNMEEDWDSSADEVWDCSCLEKVRNSERRQVWNNVAVLVCVSSQNHINVIFKHLYWLQQHIFMFRPRWLCCVKFPVTNNIVIVFHYSTFNCGQWLQKEEDSHNKMGRHHHRHHDHREHHHHDHHHHRRRRHKINFEDVESINLVLGTSSSMPTQEQEKQHHHEHHQHQDHHDSGAMSLDRIGKRWEQYIDIDSINKILFYN